MKKINLIHLVISLEVGGMENGVVNTLRLINREKFNPSVVCLETLGPLSKRLNGYKTELFNLNKKPGFSFKLILRIARILKNKKIDIIHTHCWATLIYGVLAAKLAKVPIIIHGEHGDFNLENKNRRYLYPIFIRFVDKILTVSESLKKEIKKHTGKNAINIKTIINGVDTHRFRPQKRKNVKKQLGFKDNDIIIGSVGRLDIIKNYQLIVRCVSILKDHNIKGIIIGEGENRRELEKLINELGIEKRFIILGEKDNVDELIGCIDIFISSSFSEGLSNTILEAMASGIPVLATNVGGNPEIVKHGKNGFLFETNNLKELCSRVSQLINNKSLCKIMGEKGRSYALSEHSLKRMAKQYEDEYLSLY